MDRTIGGMAAITLAGALAACSSGSSGGDEAPPTYDELEALEDSLGDEIGAEFDQNGYTDPSTLPSAGTATYEGVIDFDTDGAGGVPEFFQGEMTVVADFATANDPISGTATNFVTDADEALSGSLALQDSFLDRGADPFVEYTYGAGIMGTLTTEGGLALNVSGDAYGDFFGADADYTGMDTEGVVATSQGTAEFEGFFVGEE